MLSYVPRPQEQGGVLLDLDGVTLQTPDGASTLVQNLSVKVWLSCLATCITMHTAVASDLQVTSRCACSRLHTDFKLIA